jgi:predicted nucleic acid-binding protein
MAAVLADTGALVALLDRSDGWHEWAVEAFSLLRPPVLTCEAVLAEAFHLLGGSGPSRRALAQLHSRQILRTAFDFEGEAGAVWHLLDRYHDLPMDFADACIVLSGWQKSTQVHASGLWIPILASIGEMGGTRFP